MATVRVVCVSDQLFEKSGMLEKNGIAKYKNLSVEWLILESDISSSNLPNSFSKVAGLKQYGGSVFRNLSNI